MAFAGRVIQTPDPEIRWYSRNGSDRIEGTVIQRFEHRGTPYFVLEGPDGTLDVRPDYLVTETKEGSIGFGGASDEIDAEIGDIMFGGS